MGGCSRQEECEGQIVRGVKTHPILLTQNASLRSDFPWEKMLWQIGNEAKSLLFDFLGHFSSKRMNLL